MSIQTTPTEATPAPAVTVGAVVKTGASGKVVPGTGLAEAGAIGIALDKAGKDGDVLAIDVRN